MSRGKRDRLYYREGRGWYADLRDYADVGGRRQAMVPQGKRRATEDRDEATFLLTRRLEELDGVRQGTEPRAPSPKLEEYARRHLELKALNRRSATVARDERALRIVLGHLGSDVRLADIDVATLSSYVQARSRKVGAQTILHELHALSSLFKRAVSENVASFNPISVLVDKPTVEREEAEWLEIGESGRLIECAFARDRKPVSRAVGCLGPIIATFLLTGGRWGEVVGLEVSDIDFDRRKVRFRHNRWRRLKRNHHDRRVPLWPQLEEILREYVESRGLNGGLLFPSPRGEMFRDLRASRDKALSDAEIEGKKVTWHTFRHTYGAARMQTTDHGAPVSPYTVMRELGHQSISLIEKTYGHLMDEPYRSPVVEYRVTEVIDFQRKRQA